MTAQAPSMSRLTLFWFYEHRPVQRQVGIENGSSHCFGTSVVTDCPQTHGAGLPAQTATLLLNISLNFQPEKHKRHIKRGHVMQFYVLLCLWSVTSCSCIYKICQAAQTKVSNPKRYSLLKLRLIHAAFPGFRIKP